MRGQVNWKIMAKGIVFLQLSFRRGFVRCSKETEHNMMHALSVLSSTRVGPAHNEQRSEEFKKAFANSVRFSRRFVNLSWGSLEGYRALHSAFFGLKRNPPTNQ